jgi:acyl-CoA synthetase (AMP-forming)/AMP-acid ligase II
VLIDTLAKLGASGSRNKGTRMNLYDYLLEHATPSNIAIIEGGEAIRYGELVEMVEGIANALQEAGVGFQERVGIAAANSAAWVASYLGILKIGAVATPFPSQLTREQFAEFCHVADCRAFCVDTFHLRKYAPVIPNGSIVVSLGRDVESNAAGEQSTQVRPHETCATAAVEETKDLAALMFTSGTTGTPNAVKVSHRNIIANTNSIIEYLQLSAADRIMVVLPFHYCFGTSLLHTHLRVGASLVLNNAFQYIGEVLEQMDCCACTGFAGVPSVYQQLLSHSSFREYQLVSLRTVQQAGGKLADKFIRELKSALPQASIFIMYGQTEATARLSYLPPERLGDKLGSIGRGIPGVELRVVNHDGEQAQPGEIGEIVAKGDNVALGYLTPDPSKEPFREGKLYTGDMAYYDDEGFIFVVGRTSDFLKPSGFRVSAASIENAVAEIVGILEVAVVGVPHAKFGEAAKAFIVVEPGRNIAAEEIVNHCRRALPFYAVPQEIVFLNELPKNSARKVLKEQLKQMQMDAA